VPDEVGVPLIVMVLDAHVAETPDGNPLAPDTPLFEIPVAPVVAIVMLVSAVLTQRVGDDDGVPAVLVAVTVYVDTLVAVPMGVVTDTVPVVPLPTVTVTEFAVVAVIVAGVPPMATEVAPNKFVPFMVSEELGQPLPDPKVAIVGGAGLRLIAVIEPTVVPVGELLKVVEDASVVAEAGTARLATASSTPKVVPSCWSFSDVQLVAVDIV